MDEGWMNEGRYEGWMGRYRAYEGWMDEGWIDKEKTYEGWMDEGRMKDGWMKYGCRGN